MMSQVGHLPFFLSDTRCEVVAVAENRPSLVDALGRQRGIGRITTNHREIFDDPTIAAVVLSVPRPATAPMTHAALTAGKHVLAEKPMALTYEDARALVDVARSRGLIYAVGFMKRYDPGVQKARAIFQELITDRRLGQLLLARFYNFSKDYAVPPPVHVRPKESRAERFPEGGLWPQWLSDEWRSTYGWFLNAASHDLNLIHYFFTETMEVVAASSPSDNAISAILRHDDTAVTLEVAKSAVGVWREGAEFLFENGRLNLEIPSPMAVDQVGKVTLEENINGYRTVTVETDRGWCFARQARGYIDALEGIAAPLASGEDSLRDMALNDAIWRKISGVE